MQSKEGRKWLFTMRRGMRYDKAGKKEWERVGEGETKRRRERQQKKGGGGWRRDREIDRASGRMGWTDGRKSNTCIEKL